MDYCYPQKGKPEDFGAQLLCDSLIRVGRLTGHRFYRGSYPSSTTPPVAAEEGFFPASKSLHLSAKGNSSLKLLPAFKAYGRSHPELKALRYCSQLAPQSSWELLSWNTFSENITLLFLSNPVWQPVSCYFITLKSVNLDKYNTSCLNSLLSVNTTLEGGRMRRRRRKKTVSIDLHSLGNLDAKFCKGLIEFEFIWVWVWMF